MSNFVLDPAFRGAGTTWIGDSSAGFTITALERAELPDGSGRFGWHVSATNTTAVLRKAGVAAALPAATWAPVEPLTDVPMCATAHTVEAPGAGGGVSLTVDWHDSAGDYLSASSSAIETVYAADERAFSFTPTSPALAAYARLSAAYYSDDAADVVDGYLTNLCIGEDVYVDGNSLWYRWAGTPDASWSIPAVEALTLADGVAPLLVDQEADAGSKVVQAITAPLEPIGLLARDVSLLTDPVNGPDNTIRFQAMLRGLRGAYGESIARLRDRMANPPSWEVGSTDAIAESVRGVLTPLTPGVPAYVAVRSNSNPATFPAYALNETTVIVNPAEALVSDAVIKAAAESGAPDWVVIHVLVAAGEAIDDTTGTIDSRATPLDET